MLLNIFYCAFFGMLDFVIYSVLSGAFKVPKNIILLIIGITAIIILLHTGMFKISSLMTWEDFFGLLMFSIGLVILHFGSKLQDVYFKNRQESLNQKLYENYKIVFDFVRYKLIYVMIYIYQFLAVWNESYR